MKITLDVSQLLQDNKITQVEYDKLLSLSSREGGRLAINILIAFGIVAVTWWVIALEPSTLVGFILASILLWSGSYILYKYKKEWGILWNIFLVIWALGIWVTLLQIFPDTKYIFIVISILFATISIFTESGLLSAFSALAISPLLSIWTFYWHASYTLFVEQPILTIIIYGILAYIFYWGSHKLSNQYERLAIIFSRTSLLMVNFGFWVGSLWGDNLLDSEITEWLMAMIWAISLILVGIWWVKINRRFVVNTVATFWAIHFYTQWFERLWADPVSIILAWILAIVISIGLWKYNKYSAA